MKTNIRLNLFVILAALFALWAIPGTACGQIYVVNTRDENNNINGTVGKYNLDGTLINAAFIADLYRPQDVVVSGNTVFVSDINGGGPADGVVRKYDATTGAAIDTAFVTGFNYPQVMAISGNVLYVVSPASGFVAVYDATTGATINSAFITGLSYPTGITIDGNDLYVSSQVGGVFGFVNKYDATTGAPISVPLVSGLFQTPEGLAVDGNILYVGNAQTCPNTGFIGEYDATTGSEINASLISGLAPCGALKLVLLGNELYLAETTAGTVGVYDATTGAAINSSLISGLYHPFGFIVVQPSEPTPAPTPAVSPTPPPTPTPSPTGTPQIGPPTDKDECKNGGWQIFNTPRTFINQGDCIQFVNTGR